LVAAGDCPKENNGLVADVAAAPKPPVLVAGADVVPKKFGFEAFELAWVLLALPKLNAGVDEVACWVFPPKLNAPVPDVLVALLGA
jgi:hypothetical protein